MTAPSAHLSDDTRLTVTDPGAPRIRPGVVITLALAVTGAAVTAALADRWAEAAALAVALVVAELLPIHLPGRGRMSSWYAVVVPVAALSSAWEVMAVGVAARLVTLPAIASGSRDASDETLIRAHAWKVVAVESVERLGALAAAHAGLRLGEAVLPAGGGPGSVVGFVLAAACSLGVDAAWHRRRGRAAGVPAAALAVGASGVLMGLAFSGVGDHGRLGLWGVPLFGVPLLAARYAFGRLDAVRLAYDQTIDVLSVVPEIGGLVRQGHARHVADLSVALGRRLGLSGSDLVEVERAALLHSIGRVTFDAPDRRADPVTPADVASATADMLRGSPGLSRSAQIVAAVPLAHGDLAPDVASADRLLAQVVKAAADFDEASAGERRRAARGLERLLSAPSDVYDPRVLDALERVVAPDVVAAAV